MKDQILDPVIVKYFEELAGARLMTPDETRNAFNLMETLNKDLVVQLHTNKHFWTLIYKHWIRLQRLGKVSSKLSIDHSGSRSGNKLISSNIDNLLKTLPEQDFQPQFCSTIKLLSLKIRRPIYFKIYEKLLENNYLNNDEISIFYDLKDTREEIVNNNLRLVVTFVKPYRDKGVNFADLIQEGNIGLMRAIDKYRTDAGTQFSTYARWWI